MWKWLTFLLLLSPKTGIYIQPSPPSTADPTDCAPPLHNLAAAADGHYAPVFPGWGHYHYKIATTSDSAQYFFDQGLSLYYSYHLAESAASFKEATRRDSNCTMAYWGEALALGPYYNNTWFYKMPPEVLPVLKKMNALAASANPALAAFANLPSANPASANSAHANPREADLISALNNRYSNDTSDSHRPQLNHAWSQAVRSLIAKYPDDNDIKALYIDGVMTEHAWDFWDQKGNPRPWTAEVVDDCQDILKRNPDHPAALHYHIHLLEASHHPEATLSSANRLKDLMPGVAHMVHMASHSYQRTGLYDRGVAINDSANAALRNYGSLAPQLHLSTSSLHYNAVEAFCALNGGMYEKGMVPARKCRAMVAARKGVINTNLQYLSMMPEFVMVRLGKWQQILDEPVPDSRWVYATLISHFARGMAYLRTGRLASAKSCLVSLNTEIKDNSLHELIPPFSEPVVPSSVAQGILEGEILSAEDNPAAAITAAAMTAFQHAIAAEDGLSYSEPKDWPLPARQFAAAFLLKTGKPAEAERLYHEDLVENPGNGWSLIGLAQSLEAQPRFAAPTRSPASAQSPASATPPAPAQSAAACRARARSAFKQAESIPTASVY
jgi:hypothetical protein